MDPASWERNRTRCQLPFLNDALETDLRKQLYNQSLYHQHYCSLFHQNAQNIAMTYNIKTYCGFWFLFLN